MLIDKSFRELLDAIASSDPTPGGGSASAAAGAMGASLLLMVSGLPKTRNGSEDDRAALAAAGSALTSIRMALTAAVDEDTAAYDAVVAAYKKPKSTPDEVTARKAGIQAAMRLATEVPLRVVRLCGQALAEGATVQTHGYASAASDVGVGLALLKAAREGARLNVEINLGSLTDTSFVESVNAELAALARD